MAEDARTTLEPSLATTVAFLSRPDIYPDHSVAVESIETHMAWVFLTRTRAYKLKKPVRYDYLDFSTVEARRRNCEAEVRLNRRLAPDVYLGTIPLTLRAGALGLGGADGVVDWLVVMRRLDRERMLDRAIQRGDWTRAQIETTIAWLAAFYQRARRPDLAPGAYRARLAADLEESRREIVAPAVLGAAERAVDDVATRLLSFLERAAARFDARVAAGRIVEGHGDLRPEHIFLGPPAAIIDCIEFNAEFRELDAIDDLAFLCLECERTGAPGLAGIILQEYARATGDEVDPEIVAFHTAQRALLRAKIALWHLRDDGVRRPGHWVQRARDYVRLAVRHCADTVTAG